MISPGRKPGTAKAAEPFCVQPRAPFSHPFGTWPAVAKKLNESGPVQATWTTGDTVDITYVLKLPHGGSYSYYLCMDGSDTWECFQKTPLHFEGTGGVFKKQMMIPGPHKDRLILPPDVQCDRCTLAWRWDALMEPAVFVNCADISIIGESGKEIVA